VALWERRGMLGLDGLREQTERGAKALSFTLVGGGGGGVAHAQIVPRGRRAPHCNPY
jgi:hypothetical protein